LEKKNTYFSCRESNSDCLAHILVTIPIMSAENSCCQANWVTATSCLARISQKIL
jgi:hypothetical protein